VIDLTTGEALGENERGELYIRGPQVMKGDYEGIIVIIIVLTKDALLRAI
jgi:long-subunit acyl-CoA synthetase (AMP-forming)